MNKSRCYLNGPHPSWGELVGDEMPHKCWIWAAMRRAEATGGEIAEAALFDALFDRADDLHGVGARCAPTRRPRPGATRHCDQEENREEDYAGSEGG